MADAPSRLVVLLTEGAARDIEGIHRYISDTDCADNADDVLDRLLEVVDTLSGFP